MATPAVLESVVVHTIQTSPSVGSAENCNTGGANNDSAASLPSSRTSEQENGLRHRSSQASEISAQQEGNKDENIPKEGETVTPSSDGADKYKGKRMN